jgi:hypothetical protein
MQESPQLSGLEKTICADCVVDSALAELVKANLSSSVCSYCGQEGRNGCFIAAPYNVIMERIYDSIFKYYADAQDTSMPWVEKNWLVPETNIWEIIEDFDIEWSGEFIADLADSCDPSLYLVEHVDSDWSVENQYFSLLSGWQAFKDQILYKTRYLFLSEPVDEYSSDRPDYISISNMLDALGNLCNQENLLTTIPKGTECYRVRVMNEDDNFISFSDVGVPPKGKACAGRMNPAGISYFYVAFDQKTAEKEVISSAEKWAIARFRVTEDLLVVDFACMPQVPSIFQPEEYEARQNLLFLESFVNDLTLPISKDGSEHVDYVPTQIVSEYFRYRFRTEGKVPILGIRYPSVKHEGGINLAIFESELLKLEKYFELESIKSNMMD